MVEDPEGGADLMAEVLHRPSEAEVAATNLARCMANPSALRFFVDLAAADGQ